MNIALLAANMLTLMAFIIHAVMGDKELKIIEPKMTNDEGYLKQEKWTMARSGWHWISLDLLFASVGLALINFTDHLENERQLLQLLSIYFIGYGIAWLVGISISRSFPRSYLRLGQWILLWLIGGLIYFGIS